MTVKRGQKTAVVEVSAAEAAELLAGRNPPIIIDVRQPGEFRSGHMVGARSHPLLGGVRGAGGYDHSSAVLVVCASGHRSRLAARLLQLRGFERLLSLRGGTEAWSEANFPME